MDYKNKHKEEIIRATQLWECGDITRENLEYIFPELRESEDNERIRRDCIKYLDWEYQHCPISKDKMKIKKWIAWLEKQGEQIDKGEISDGYHTFNELYYYRMLYNAAFFNLLPKEWVHKSKKHHDGEECFGGGWFIVMANLPTGQISNHYELKDWDLFQIPEKEMADEWDGHTPQEAAERLHKYLEKQAPKNKTALDNAIEKEVDIWLKKQGEQKTTNKVEPKFKVGDFIVNDYCMGKVIELTNDAYLLDTGQGIPFSCEHNVHLWTIADAKDGDVLRYKGCTFIFKKTEPSDIVTNIKNPLTVLGYCGINHIGFEKTNGWGDTANCKYHPATKEQRDALEKAMADAGYTFDFEKKELKKIEEEYDGLDYGIDGLWHAQRILEKTLGKVEGYQSDDGILEHKCAISAVKKLYKKVY